MKKLLALLAVMTLTVAANAGMIVPMIGIDGQGGQNLNVTNVSPAAAAPYLSNTSANVSPGLDIGVEYRQLAKPNSDFTYGAGLEYLFQRVLNTSSVSPAFQALPLYLTGQYSFLDSMSCKPYIKLNLGWNLSNTGNSDWTFQNSSAAGGFYWAIGIGGKVYKDTIVAELLYQSFAGKHTGYTLTPNQTGAPATVTWDSNDTYSVLGIKVGYCFDLCSNCSK